MKKEVKEIMKEALRRSKADGWFDWPRCSPEIKESTFKMFLAIIVLERELNQSVEDLDIVALNEVRKMVINSNTDYTLLYKLVPDPTDSFLTEKVTTKIKIHGRG